MRAFHVVLLIFVIVAAPLDAAPREVRLFAAPELVETGVLRYALPRFKLKTQIRVVLVADRSMAEVILAQQAPEDVAPLFTGPGGSYAAWPVGTPEAPVKRFLDWLASEIGLRTLTSYQRDGLQVVFPVEARPDQVETSLPQGDVVAGRSLAYRNCGRCHVIGADNRMQGIESTPSFALLRVLPDWQARFATYYRRIPHPAFTQIDGLTEPFDAMLPSPIAPLALTLDEFNAILAFVARVDPADLGAPLEAR